MKHRAWEIDRVQAPLTIGVTGHRDLRDDDIDRLERKVEQIFERLRRQYRFTPLVVLSALAEGADRLVARIALRPEFGARLVVPLPMPRMLYALDFEKAGSLEEFDDLLERADSCFEISPVGDPEALLLPGAARDRRYEEVGMFIVRQCQILIALWDGVDSGKTGGTSAVVRFHTEGIRGVGDEELQPPELFPVYHILTPRRSHPSPTGEPFRLKEIYPSAFHREDESGKEGSAATYYATLFRNLDDFNRRVAEGGDKLLDRAARCKREVIGNLDESKLSLEEALALDRYAVADALAVPLQRKMVLAQRVLHLAVFGWFVCLVFFAHLEDHFTPLLGLYVALLLSSGLIVRYARRNKLENHSLDYRALAEGCRVKFFWIVAGIANSVPDNYLGTQRTELDWTRNGLRGWEIQPSQSSPETFSSLRERFEFVLRHWAEEQHSYFRKAAKRDHKRLRRWELISRGLLAAAIATSGALALTVEYLHPFALWCQDCAWIGGFVIPIDVLLAAAALCHHFNERMAYSEHVKQYRRMEGVFGLASKIVREKLAAGDAPGLRETLRTLGKEALVENGDWVLMHRERPIELPHP
jgi:hypothetical protein